MTRTPPAKTSGATCWNSKIKSYESHVSQAQIKLASSRYLTEQDPWGKSMRQIVRVNLLIDSGKAWGVNKLIKEKDLKNISDQTQAEMIRVTGTKRNHLQTTLALLESAKLKAPLQARISRS